MRILPHNFKEKLVYGTSMLLTGLINSGRDLSAFNFKKILCIKLDEIGDMVYALHVFSLLKKDYPEAEITVLCKPYVNSLLADDPHIKKVVNDFASLEKDYDLIADMRGNMQSILFALANRPKVRLDRGTIRYRNKKKGGHPHEVFTNLEVIQPVLKSEAGLPKPKLYFNTASSEKASDFIHQNRIGKFAVLHTGARKILRKWPAENYAALAKYLKEKRGLDIVFTGDESERHEIDGIRKTLAFASFSIAGEFSLVEFAALLKHASFYAGNESGPLAIAAVSGIPCLGLYGPGEPYVFYPYGEKTSYLHYVLDCNPCDQVHCVHPENPCITRISVAEAVTKADELLK